MMPVAKARARSQGLANLGLDPEIMGLSEKFGRMSSLVDEVQRRIEAEYSALGSQDEAAALGLAGMPPPPPPQQQQQALPSQAAPIVPAGAPVPQQQGWPWPSSVPQHGAQQQVQQRHALHQQPQQPHLHQHASPQYPQQQYPQYPQQQYPQQQQQQQQQPAQPPPHTWRQR
jgi:hypothetical protein